MVMRPFEFHPELLEIRTNLIGHLAANGFEWLSHYGAVDVQHDIYGLEVTTIKHKDDAKAIQAIVSRFLPEWTYSRIFYEDLNVSELGWKVIISRSPEDFGDSVL